MKSKTKYPIGEASIIRLFAAAGILNVTSVSALGNGEFSAVYSVSARDRDYVIKIAPPDHADVMTYERNMLAYEVFWYDQIHSNTCIRVPQIVYADFSRTLLPSAYIIIEKLEGETLDKANLSEVERAKTNAMLAGMLADIHKISRDGFGYEQCGIYKTWTMAIRAIVEQTLSDCNRKRRRSRRGERLLRFIDRHGAVLDKALPAMVNFDLWPSNVIVQRKDGALTLAWIDPERSFWGDPVVDFVCLAFSRPLEQATSALINYNAASAAPVALSRETRIRYAVGQAYLALIMETEKYYRYSPLRFGWWRNVLAAHILYRAAFRTLED